MGVEVGGTVIIGLISFLWGEAGEGLVSQTGKLKVWDFL